MKLKQKLIFLLLMYLSSQVSYALSVCPPSTLTLIIVNHSQHSLRYAGVTHMRLGNVFSINHPEILPAGSAIVTGTAQPFTDLNGVLRFIDDTGKENFFTIADSQQFNASVPLFVLDNSRFISFVQQVTLNPANSPALSYIAAVVVIQDNPLVRAEI